MEAKGDGLGTVVSKSNFKHVYVAFSTLPSSLSLWVYIVSGFVLWQVLDLAGLSFAVALVSTATFVRFWTLLRLAALLVQDLHLALKELSVVLVLLVSASLPLGRARIWRPALTAIVALLA